MMGTEKWENTLVYTTCTVVVKQTAKGPGFAHFYPTMCVCMCTFVMSVCVYACGECVCVYVRRASVCVCAHS